MRRTPRKYHIGDAEGLITASQLRRVSQKVQREVMSDWFHEHFQDPVECCPHDSGEGGYQYIYGGPYEPHEVLVQEFDGIVSFRVIEELADKLADQSWQWSGRDSDTDDDWDPNLSNYYFQSLKTSAGPLVEFQRSIEEVQTLLKGPIVDGGAGQCLLRLLYVNVITALESYLADFFSSAITEHKELFRRFVEINPEFEKEKLPFNDIFKAWEGLDARVKAYLVEIVWHHLGRIKPMFRDALGVEFPDADELFKAVLVRHDIVHRNGKKKDGGEHAIIREDVNKLIAATETFVNGIEKAWQKVKPGAEPMVAESIVASRPPASPAAPSQAAVKA